MKILTRDGYFAALDAAGAGRAAGRYAMYSSEFDAIVADPLLWRVPVDDHLVHRGDGVFEMFKCEKRAAYNMEAHLSRLERSARTIGIEWPEGIDGIRRKTIETMAYAGRSEQYVRIMLSRGPGSFAVNPFDSAGAVLYIIVYEWHAPFMELHPEGAKACRADVALKEPRFASVKTCNYLPNAMMKREAVERGCDFPVSFDSDGFLAEGATENIGIVTRAGELLFPEPERILAGTTMLRAMELAETLVREGALRAVRHARIAAAEVDDAAEILVAGTTLDVAAAVEWNGRPVGDGRPGPVASRLAALFREDIATNETLRTPY